MKVKGCSRKKGFDFLFDIGGFRRFYFTVQRRLKILFVCSLNQVRSLTADHMYRHDARLEVRSGGTRSDANRRVSEADVRWADVIFAMSREHKRWIAEQFHTVNLPRIDVLDVPDDFNYMDDDLQEMLRMTLDPEIESLLETGDGLAP